MNQGRWPSRGLSVGRGINGLVMRTRMYVCGYWSFDATNVIHGMVEEMEDLQVQYSASSKPAGLIGVLSLVKYWEIFRVR